MADIKHTYICTSNFCAAGRRADPGVCVAWSVPLRLLRDRCSMHDATRNMGRVIPRACEMFCVRASCLPPPRTNPNAHAACPKQGRHHFPRFLLRPSSRAIVARRSQA